MELNGTQQLLVVADDIGTMDRHINTVKKDIKALSDEVGLEVNAQKTQYVVTSTHQNAGPSHNYESLSESFRTGSITKCTLTIINSRWEATQRVMAAKLTRLTQKNSDTTAPSGREVYHLQFSLQPACPVTFGYNSYIIPNKSFENAQSSNIL
jgi:hypothetical protein